MKKKLVRYLIVVFSVVAIIAAIVKLVNDNKKCNTYLVLGDYLSVSGSLKGERINSFSSILGDYLVEKELVNSVNNSYTSSSIDSELLLEMICKDAYNGSDSGLVSLIKDSKYITVSVGMNDILKYLRFDSNKQEIVYDKEYIKRKLEIMKHNYYEIVENIKEINGEVNIYLMSYYCPFTWVSEENIGSVKEVFSLLNDSIKEVSELMDVYYVDISEVSKEENMFSKYQVYLNELGHEYIFSVIKNNYFN